MRIVLADSGPLYALVDRDDQHHRRSQAELEQLGARGRAVGLAVPILMESYSLVLHRLGPAVAHRWLSEIEVGTGRIHPVAADVTAACERLSLYPDQDITLFDAVLGELADRLDAPVWTFDHHFDVMAVEVWRSSHPGPQTTPQTSL